MIQAIISFIVGIIEFLLAFRFVFLVFGANPANGFVSWIYDMSQPLAAPFIGIFGSPRLAEGAVVTGVFEVASLIAIVVYGLIGYALMRLLGGIDRRVVMR